MFHSPFGIQPADGRIVFGDLEAITLSYEHRFPWEIALIVRDPGKPDIEIEWQLRPNLHHADPISLRVGRYYRRNRAQTLEPGRGLIITAPDRPELAPHTVTTSAHLDREVTAAQIANQTAQLLDGAVLIGQGPWYDDLALHHFLRDHNQALTSSHRLMCVNNASVGYLNGKADALAQLGHTDEAEKLRAEIPPPPWDPEKLSLLTGVTPPPAETRHRALVDARWVRDRWDAITGYKRPTTPAAARQLAAAAAVAN